MTLELSDLAAIAGLIVFIVGPLVAAQVFWIDRSMGRIETTLDAFRTEHHADMALHTESIVTLREKVARLERNA